jgi:HEAT repeat protein
MDEAGRDERLVAAVRAGDAGAVRDLLSSGASPDATGKDGLPVLCAAVAAYEGEVVRALVENGADPDRLLPDGTTPLWRAIDGGSPAVFTSALGRDLRLLPEAERQRLLALARDWAETGTEAELRRRTGASGPAESVRVEDGEFGNGTVELVSLGGRSVRAGHGAIVTLLESYLGVLTPREELMARAFARTDPDHVERWAAAFALSDRRDRETWSSVVADRHHPDRDRRGFVLRVLRYADVVRFVYPCPYEREETDLLAAWVAEETDPELLRDLLDLFLGRGHPEQEAIALRYADHPDAPVRAEVPYALGTEGAPLTPAARTALLALARDPDPGVRSAAGSVLGQWHDLSPEVGRALLDLTRDPDPWVRRRGAEALALSEDRSPEASAALWALRGEEDQQLRLEGAHGLARRDDPRTEEAYERVGPLTAPEFEHDHRVGALLHHRWRRDDRSAVTAT